MSDRWSCGFTVQVRYTVDTTSQLVEGTKGTEEELTEQVKGMIMDELGFLEGEPGCSLSINVIESYVEHESFKQKVIDRAVEMGREDLLPPEWDDE